MTIEGAFGLSLFPVVLASLVLLLVAAVVSRWLGLGVEGSVLWAGVRATVQLLAVGLLFTLIFRSSHADLWAWLWVGVMVAIATTVLVRRAPDIPGLWAPSLLAVGSTVAVALAVVFGFGVLEMEPVRLVVVAGLTIGNSMPSGVGGAKQVAASAKERQGEIEALLALGLDRRHVMRYLAPPAASLALVPQIERTKVVGLIALPGAMAGLLLGGADPLEAVILQLLVMFLVLGAVALSVMTLAVFVARGTVSRELGLATWVRQ